MQVATTKKEIKALLGKAQRGRTDRTAKDALSEARAALESQRYERVLELCDEGTALDPERADAHVLRAKALEALERYEEAEEAWRRACELEPKDKGACAYSRAYNLSTNLKRHADAEAALRSVLPDLKSADHWHLLAQAVGYYQGRFEESLPFWEKACSAADASPSEFGNAAYALAAAGKIPEAIEKAQRALEGARKEGGLVVEQRFYLYAICDVPERTRHLRKLQEHLRDGLRTEDWDFTPIIDRAGALGHPDHAWLAPLARVCNGLEEEASLSAWPTWGGVSDSSGPSEKPVLEVAWVGRDRSSSEGKIAVSGHKHLALVDKATGKIHFRPPRSVAIAFSDSQLVSWRVDRRDGGSGIGRGDYDWIIELYSFPDAPRFQRGYKIRSREVIGWCWPDKLTFPKAQKHRLAVVTGRSEDFTRTVFVVLHEDETFSETLDRPTALALLAGRAVDPEKLVSHRVPADSLPIRFPPDPLGRAMERYLAALERLDFAPLLRSGARPEALAALEARLGSTLPPEIASLLTIADGEYEPEGSALGGFSFLGSAQSARWLESEGRPGGVVPIAKEPLRQNYVGVVVAPAEGGAAAGPPGAVVAFGPDEEGPVALFPSVTAMFEWLADAAEGGAFRVVPATGDEASAYLTHRLQRLPNAVARSREG